MDGSEQGGPPAPLLHKHCSLAPSHSDTLTKLASSGMTVPLPVASLAAVSQGVHSAAVAPSGSDQSAKPPPPLSSSQSNPPAVALTDSGLPKSQSGAESWSQPPVLRESGGSGEKEEGGAASRASVPSSMPPLSHHGAQDHAQAGPAETLHSKPPLLHPAPPLTVPTVLPSATPPPPPLTPVLPHDPNRKETPPNSGQSTPQLSSADGQQAELTLSPFSLRDAPRTASPVELTAPFSLRDALRTASPLALEPDLATVDRGDGTGVPADSDSVDGKSPAEEAAGRLPDVDSTCATTASSDTDGLRPVAGEPTSADPSSEEGNPKVLRFARKRKSTHSESDSSLGEPAPKLSCVESAQGNGDAKEAECSKTDTPSENPPTLHREGKKSNIADQKEEEKGGEEEEEKGTHEERKEEEIGGNREEEQGEPKDEEGKGVRREEERAASKNMGPHHDRNILDATPEEIAKKMAAVTTGGRRRIHYAYVPEKSLNQSKHAVPFHS